MNNQETEKCLFCGSTNLTFNESMAIVCEDCKKTQPERCPYCGNDSVILSAKTDEAFKCSKCGKPSI